MTVKQISAEYSEHQIECQNLAHHALLKMDALLLAIKEGKPDAKRRARAWCNETGNSRLLTVVSIIPQNEFNKPLHPEALRAKFDELRQATLGKIEELTLDGSPLAEMENRFTAIEQNQALHAGETARQGRLLEAILAILHNEPNNVPAPARFTFDMPERH